MAAINPKTGAILALVSAPSYDPNQLASPSATVQNDYANQLNNNALQPKLDQALNETYPPGSTFKIVTSAAALADGIGGQTINPELGDHRGPAEHPDLLPQSTSTDLQLGRRAVRATSCWYAFAQSCNTVYGYIGMQVGDANLQSMAEAFGYNKPGPTIPMQASTLSVFSPNLNQAQLAQSAIGQFNVTMTPLEGAMMASAVANGGVIEAPYLIAKELDTKGNVIASATPTQFSAPINSTVAGELGTMMQGVVTSPEGTATSLRDIGVPVAAKTGTAQRGAGQNAVAWMVAYAPATDPTIAVAVMVADNGVQNNDAFGNSLAGPIAASVIKADLGQG